MQQPTIKVLLIEDDEDDFIITRGVLSRVEGTSYDVKWASSFDAGIEALERCEHEVILLDYRLGERNGIELLHTAAANACDMPLILLTGESDREIDLEAARAGASDFIIKGEITAPVLERSIRYAIERKKAERAVRRANDELEERVAERNADLLQAVGSLREEIAEREESEAVLQSAKNDLEQMNRIIAQSQERYRQLADAMPQIVWTAQANGAVDYYNQRWFDYAGKTLEQTKGWGWKTVLHPDEAEKCRETWRECVRTGAPFEVEYRFLRAADNTYRWHLGRALAVRDGNGAIVKWFGSCTDIEESKRIGAELEKSQINLEERVEQRTAELYRTNQELEKEVVERKQIEETLRIKKALLIKAQQISHLGSWEWNIAANKFLWSDEIYSLFGLEPQSFEPTFDSYIKHIHPSDTARVVSLINSAVSEKNYPDYDHRIVRPDGETRFVHASGIVLVDETTGEPLKITGVVQDITERKQFEKELAEARDAALESVRLKSEFLANMSHEIRTPMNGVIGMTGLLLDTDLSVRQKEFTRAIELSADALLSIIDDILDFSKIEAGQLRFETIDFDLRGAVEQSVEWLAERAQKKGIEIASLILKDVPTGLRGDPGRLRQILTNLLGNAVKFTERGEVVLRVFRESESAEHTVLRFEIKDSGIGIAPDVQTRLFQPFEQADGSMARKYGGTGLGLAISKQLVEMMGGEIGVKTAPGAGSTFWFTAKFEKQPHPAAIAANQNGTSLNGGRLLIVDENATNRKILLYQTGLWGMIGAEAGSGAEALEIMRAAARQNEPFDVAIFDLMMPEMSDFQLARTIKTDETIASVSLVLLPSYGERGHGQTAREVGIAAYLQKPIRQSQLYDCLLAIAAERSARRAGGQPTSLITKHSLRDSSLAEFGARRVNLTRKPGKALVLVAEDNAINREVAFAQLESLGYATDIVCDGREAVEALEESNYDVIFMDCQMPEMDGFEATAEIRSRESGGRQTTIIAMTAHAFEGEREKCLAAGMDDFISKPVKIDALQQMIERWTATNGGGRTDISSNGSPTDDEPSVDFSVLESFSYLQRPNSSSLVDDLIDLFVKDTSGRVSNLRQMLADGDGDALKKAAHNVKGAAGNIGARQMAQLCRELEQNTERQSEAEVLITRLEQEFKKVSDILILRKSDEKSVKI